MKLLPPVSENVSFTVLTANVRLFVANETPPIERLPVTVAFSVVSTPLVNSRPVVEPLPNPTLSAPMLGIFRKALPFMVNLFVIVFAVIFRPTVWNVDPATVRLLLTVILTLVSDPLVIISPVELAPPKMTLSEPIFDWESVALPVIANVLAVVFTVMFSLLAVKLVLRMDRFPLTVTFIDVSEPFVTVNPVELEPPKITLTLPIPGTFRLLLPVMVNTLFKVLAVIFRPVVLKVEPATVRLLLTVMLTLVSEPLVSTIPVELEPPKITLRLPMEGTVSVALPFIVKVFTEVLAVRFRPLAVKFVDKIETLPVTVTFMLVSEPFVTTRPVELAPPKITLTLPSPLTAAELCPVTANVFVDTA